MARNEKFVDTKGITMKETLKKLSILLGKKIYLLLLVIVLAIVFSVITIQGPLLVGKVTDILLEGIKITPEKIEYSINHSKILKAVLFVTSIYILGVIIEVVEGLIVSYVNSNLIREIRTKINEKINKLPISYLDRNLDGNIISIVTNDVTTLGNALSNVTMMIFSSVIAIVGTLVIMSMISIKLLLVVLIFIPIMFIVMFSIVFSSQKYFKEQQEKLAVLNAHIEEMYSNHDVIQAYNGQELAIEKFEMTNDALFKSAILSQFLSGIIWPMISVINNVCYSIVALLGSIFLNNGVLTIGKLQSFIQYLSRFQGPLGNLSQATTFVQQIKASSDRIFRFLNEEEMKDESRLKGIDEKEVKGNIEFKNVEFSYFPDKKIIDNISFSVKPGEKVAIVGHTGSGKTTIINLLMKFYDISSGDILIDGVSIKDISKEEIADIFTMVLQDTWLFEDTIEENIRFGSNKDVSFDDIKKAAKRANVNHFIKTLPDGYKMVLNEEVTNISVGQKQLLTIARAFLKNSKILILDEATSSIDSRTELLVQNSMEELMNGKTTFIIAHRLSTIKNCDKIVLLDKGKIIEIGSHDELMEKQGHYTSLYNSQF